MTRRVAPLLLFLALPLLLSTLLVVVSACTTTRSAAPAEAATPATTIAATSSSPAVPATAKDGTNVAACRDAGCELRLTGRTAIPVAPATGVTEVRVESITGDAVSLTITVAGTGFSVGCAGDDRCETSLVGSTPPVVVSIAHPGAEVSVNDLLLTIPAAADGTAIVALARA
jgi:hypothetical protein